jgi:lipopolysaccharide cholinephosphotransferase
MRYLISFVIAFTALLSSCSIPSQSYDLKDIKALTFMQPDAVQDLYQMLKDTHEIFERAGIRYSVSSGTLLGMVRHQGLIPWDDDADLVILHDDELKLNIAKDAFKALGYHMIIDPWDSSVYRISKIGNPEARGKTVTFPYIDVATVAVNSKQKKVMYVNWRMLQYFPTEWFHEQAFFPLKKGKFGPLTLWCAQEPMSFLSNYYGDTWRSEGSIVPRHYKPKHQDTISITFEQYPELLKPALPPRPLEDRVSRLPDHLFK